MGDLVENGDSGSLATAIAEAWCEVLGVPAVQATDKFFECGGSSLLALALHRRLEALTGGFVPLAAVYVSDTFADLVAAVSADLSASSGSYGLPLNPHGDRVPFFAAPGGWGTAFSRSVVAGMDPDQPCWGFQVLGTPLADMDYTIEELAAGFLADLNRIDPQGPYVLGGYSMGGAVAMEMARRIQDSGRQVPLLLLVDTDVPNPARLNEQVDRMQTMFWIAKQVPDVSYGDACKILEITQRSKRAMASYRPTPYDGRTVLVLAEVQEFLDDTAEAKLAEKLADAWREICVGPFDMVRVAGVTNRITSGPQALGLGAVLQQLIKSATDSAHLHQ